MKYPIIYICGLITLISACSSPNYRPANGITPDKSVLIQVNNAGWSMFKGESRKDKSYKAGADLIAPGAYAGAGVGAAAGLACGPLAILCVPAGMVVGATGGMITLGVAGNAFGGLDGLPQKDIEKLAKAMPGEIEGLPYPSSIVERNLNEKGEKIWDVNQERPDLKIEVYLHNTGFEQYLNNKIAVKIGAFYTLYYQRDSRFTENSSWSHRYEDMSEHVEVGYESPKFTVDEWLEGDEKRIRQAILTGIDEITTQIIENLQQSS